MFSTLQAILTVMGGIAPTYLWKTETQLRGPLSHLEWYSSNLGSMDSRNGPIKGVLNKGPAMLPLLRIYETAMSMLDSVCTSVGFASFANHIP